MDGWGKNASFCGCLTSLGIIFQAKGDFYRAEGEKVEARVGKSLQEKCCPEGTWAQVFVGNQRSCVGFCVVQVAMQIHWPKASPEEGHYGTRETFLFCSFFLFSL